MMFAFLHPCFSRIRNWLLRLLPLFMVVTVHCRVLAFASVRVHSKAHAMRASIRYRTVSFVCLCAQHAF